jgi:hypothetical protein
VHSAHSTQIAHSQSNAISAEVLTLALRRACDAVEFHLVGPCYVGCRVLRVPDVPMASLMLAVAARLRATPCATGPMRSRAAWKRETARLMGFSKTLRSDAAKPAQGDLIEHFSNVYIADAARELRARRFMAHDADAVPSPVLAAAQE